MSEDIQPEPVRAEVAVELNDEEIDEITGGEGGGGGFRDPAPPAPVPPQV